MAPFQPPVLANPNIPFMSFDVSSAVASTSFLTPQFGGNMVGIGNGFKDEPPLLEELRINPRQMWSKTISISNPFKVNANLHEDVDLSGPFLFLRAFGLFQLLARKLHFGIEEIEAAIGITHLLASILMRGHAFHVMQTLSIPSEFVHAISNIFDGNSTSEVAIWEQWVREGWAKMKGVEEGYIKETNLNRCLLSMALAR